MVLAMASGLVPATALADGPEEGVVDVELASDVEDIPVVQAQGEVELRPQMGLGDKRGPALTAQDSTYYLEWDGTSFVKKSVSAYENMKDFGDTPQGSQYGKWMVLKSNVTCTKRFVVKETLNLVLCNGYTLTAHAGVEVAAGVTLNIYAEEGGTGRLVATGGENNAGIGGSDGVAGGTIAIHGGEVIATGGKNAAGIGGGNAGSGATVAIYGGTVVAAGGQNATGIGGGYNSGGNGDLTVGNVPMLTSTDNTYWSVYDGSARGPYMKTGEIWTVKLTGGTNAIDSGATTQAVEKGNELQAVTYSPKDGYHFESFKPITIDGVTAEYNSGGKVCVFGTPTGDVSITIPDAVADPAPAKVAKPSTKGRPKTGKLVVSWKAAEGAESYEVRWRKSGGKWKMKATKSLKYTISALKKGGAYEVRVRAVARSTSGAWSTASRCWLHAPSKVKAKKGAEEGTIRTSWKKDKKATGGFKVNVYAKKGGKLVKTRKVKAGESSVTVQGLKASKKYYVRVEPLRKVSGKTYAGTLSGYRSVRAA